MFCELESYNRNIIYRITITMRIILVITICMCFVFEKNCKE